VTSAADIVLFGTGSFAQRILFDIAATAPKPVRVAVAGRNIARLDWLRTAANARAAIFERPVTVIARPVDLSSATAAAEVIGPLAPSVIVQAASAQTSSVISTQGNAWSRLVAEGGLSATAVFNALLTLRVAQATKAVRPAAHLVNCCYADVVNALIAARGLPVTCGVGNVAILAAVFSGELGVRKAGPVKVLAHYQTITPFRRPAAERRGPVPRVWIEGEEVGDVYARFSSVKLTPEPVIDVSGANGVPLMLAMADGRDCLAHAPGPNGLPGGYPVALRSGKLELDLPTGLSRAEAISWNARFEQENGIVVDADGQVHYTGTLHDAFNKVSPAIAKGFHVRDLEAVFGEMDALRSRLLKMA
jgi:hypothetical protein